MNNFPVPLAAPIAFAATVALFSLLVLIKRLRTGPASGGVKRDRRSLVGILLQSIGIGVACTGAVDMTRRLDDPIAIIQILATIALGLSAVLLFARSAKALGLNWSLVARTSDAHELIRSGPFARVRHPIYLAMLLFLLAGAVGLGHLWALIPAVPIFLLGTRIRTRIEERLLREMFGAEYDDYARVTPGLLPGI